MDLYTAYPDTVAPLPYHGMENYPPDGSPPPCAHLARDGRGHPTRHVALR